MQYKSGYQRLKAKWISISDQNQRLQTELAQANNKVKEFTKDRVYKVSIQNISWNNQTHTQASELMKKLIDLGAGKYVKMEEIKA